MSCGLRDVKSSNPRRPAVLVASTGFADAADEQAAPLAPALRRLFRHPIQDRTDAEVQALADGAADQLLAAVS